MQIIKHAYYKTKFAKLTYLNIQFRIKILNNFYLHSRRCEIKIFVQGSINKHIV